jgi:hypothetical protein
MEQIVWTDRLKNEEVLQRVKKERNIPHTTKWRKANWIGHILLRNCLLKHFIAGMIEGPGRWRRRPKQLLDNLKEMKRCCKLQEEALHCTLWRTCFTYMLYKNIPARIRVVLCLIYCGRRYWAVTKQTVMVTGFKSWSGDRWSKPDILVASHSPGWQILSRYLKLGNVCSFDSSSKHTFDSVHCDTRAYRSDVRSLASM